MYIFHHWFHSFPYYSLGVKADANVSHLFFLLQYLLCFSESPSLFLCLLIVLEAFISFGCSTSLYYYYYCESELEG